MTFARYNNELNDLVHHLIKRTKAKSKDETTFTTTFIMIMLNHSPPMFEMAFRQYLAIFNGSPQSYFEDFEPLFEQLYNDQAYLEDEHGPLSREETKARHAQLLAAGWKSEPIHFRRVGLNQFDVKYKLVLSEGKEVVVRKHITTIDRKIAKIQDIDGSLPMLVKSQGRATYYNMSKLLVPV